MNINRVTITGADESVPIKDIYELSERFPFVEWGILFSKSKEGMSRYPSFRWVNTLCEGTHQPHINLSAHLCGAYPRDILQDGKLDFVKSLDERFKRMQINFNFGNTLFEPKYLDHLLWNKDINPAIILQYNKSNSAVIDILEEYVFDVLYDSSGGRGTEIKEIKEPFEDYYTGYSGGLSPDNVDDFCQKLTAHPNPSSVFIDCESGVRINNEFDLKKVTKYLEICSKYIHG